LTVLLILSKVSSNLIFSFCWRFLLIYKCIVSLRLLIARNITIWLRRVGDTIWFLTGLFTRNNAVWLRRLRDTFCFLIGLFAWNNTVWLRRLRDTIWFLTGLFRSWLNTRFVSIICLFILWQFILLFCLVNYLHILTRFLNIFVML